MLSSGRWSGKADGSSVALLALAAGLLGCDFQPDPEEGPSAVPAPAVASVTIEYRQPNGCANATPRLRQPGRLLRQLDAPGQEIYLTPDPGSHVWTGVAQGVPVNWPPVEEPHLVRVFDPHLVDTPTGGVTAARLLRGRPDPHAVRLAGNAAGERPRLRRRQRRRPQPAVAPVTGQGYGRRSERDSLPRAERGSGGATQHLPAQFSARGCPGSGPRARAGARLAGRPGPPRTGARRAGGPRRPRTAASPAGGCRGQVDVRHLQAGGRVVRPPDERLGVLRERPVRVAGRASEEVPVADEHRRVLAPSPDELLEGPLRRGHAARRQGEPDHLLDRDDPRRVRLDGVAEAAEHAIDAACRLSLPPARRAPALPRRTSACGARSRAVARCAPAWSGRAAVARSRSASACSSSGLRSRPRGSATDPGAGVGTGAACAFPAQARPSR